MKIVIELSEETYKNIHQYGLFLCPRDKKELTKSLCEGRALEEQKHGHWIKVAEAYDVCQCQTISLWKCSVCDGHYRCVGEGDCKENYCSNCGARMGVEE